MPAPVSLRPRSPRASRLDAWLLAISLGSAAGLCGCGLAGTAGSAAIGAASEAQEAQQAKQIETRVQQQIQDAQQQAAAQRNQAEKDAQ